MRKSLVLITAFALLWQNGLYAQQAPASTPRGSKVAWRELGPLVVVKKIATVLPDGVRLQGEALAVRPGFLVLDVQKSSKRKLYPLGQAEIPSMLVSGVTIVRERSWAFRAAGTVVGLIGGLVGVSALSYRYDSIAAFVLGLAFLVPAGGVGGYYAGKLLDVGNTYIAVQPDAAPTGAMEE